MSVYKIEFNENNIYVGSTKNHLEVRAFSHERSILNPKKKNKLYKYCRKNNICSIKCELVEKIDNRMILREREEYWRKNLNATLNTRRCFVTPEQALEYKNRKVKCGCGKSFRWDNVLRHRLSRKHIRYVEQLPEGETAIYHSI